MRTRLTRRGSASSTSNSNRPGSGNDLAADRQAAGARHQIAADRIDFLGGIADIEVVADGADHILDRGARIGDIGTVRLLRYRQRLVFVMFVGDLADDLLDDVFDRSEAVRASIFVDHQRQMNARRLHARQKIDHAH